MKSRSAYPQNDHINVIATIGTNNFEIPPFLIYQGNNHMVDWSAAKLQKTRCQSRDSDRDGARREGTEKAMISASKPAFG